MRWQLEQTTSHLASSAGMIRLLPFEDVLRSGRIFRTRPRRACNGVPLERLERGGGRGALEDA